jgi:arabinan endo-1,5-alpha-L-arabinosidase
MSCEGDLDPAKPPKQLSLTGNLGIHDPSIIESDGAYFTYQTGPGLPIKRSTDLLAWEAKGSVFAKNPAWIAQKISGASDLWAPDISFFGGVYHVYYAASTSGSNHSCIGHATSPTADGTWTDQGSVICSNDGSSKDDWNAIDPNFVQDDAGKGYLVFGSFWGGIKLIELDDKGARTGSSLVALAARPKNGGALEAPYVVRRCGYYYLFTSWDKCCAGAASTYNMRVGRATALAGPYADMAGVALLQGGGTLLVDKDDTWHGPGHSAVLTSKGKSYDIHHAYYAGANTSAYRTDGSYLRISELAWGADGWPVSGGP